MEPFARVWERGEPHDEFRRRTKEITRRELAQIEVERLAEDLNSMLYRARTSPRLKDVVAGLAQSREFLEAANSALSSLDGWSRFHLASRSELAGIEAKWLPPPDCSGQGDFVELSSRIARQIDATIDDLRIRFGGHDTADRGGRNRYEERFLGSVKGRFVKEAFELFEAYHPGRATSHAESKFCEFVHHVYGYATKVTKEDSIAITYKLREIVGSLRKAKKLRLEIRKIEERMQVVSRDSIEYEVLHEAHKQKRKGVAAADSKVVPSLVPRSKRVPARKEPK
ncbi:hypothetical protein ABH975_007842 [Bradyrhizobium ottawaense]|uniref:hypothetical protein n=1 Tax=Bradyrhizobium ottawaense TaxID=931866 RepID=UPI0035177707